VDDGKRLRYLDIKILGGRHRHGRVRRREGLP
jgi:hypothetical protein